MDKTKRIRIFKMSPRRSLPRFSERSIFFFRGLKKNPSSSDFMRKPTPLYWKRIKKYVRPTFDFWTLWNERGVLVTWLMSSILKCLCCVNVVCWIITYEMSWILKGEYAYRLSNSKQSCRKKEALKNESEMESGLKTIRALGEPL